MFISKPLKQFLLTLAAALLLGVAHAHAHGDIELGPNGGLLLEFSENQTLHGEVTLTNGVFRVALLDQDRKPVALAGQTLTVTGGDRNRPARPEVKQEGNHFTFPALQGDQYLLVLQFRPKPDQRPVTARFTFDATLCGDCRKQEWLCACGSEDAGKPHAHDAKK